MKLAGYGEDKLSTVIVMGTLLCQLELRDSQTIAGALVGVKCMVGSKNRKMNWAHGTTDEDGSFLIDVPSHLHAIPDLDKVCLVRVLRLPKNSLCRPTARNKGIRLSSIGNGIRRYTAGNLRLQT